MKKLLLIVIAAALAISLFAIATSAEESSIEHTNIDFVCIVDSNGAIIENAGKGADLGNLKVQTDAGAAYLWLIGWHYPTKEPVDFGYQIDDGEIVYGGMNCTYNEGTSGVIASWSEEWALHADWVRTFNGYVPMPAGAHEVKLYVKYTDGNTKVIYKTKYSTDDSNIALGKPAFVDLYNVGSYGLPYWDPSFLTDGTKWLFNADLANPVPLGWYGAYAANASAKFYIDLQGVYDLSSVNIHAMGFDNASIPNAFTVYGSTDGVNWETIGKIEGVTGAVDSADPIVFTTNKRARFIMVNVDTFNTTASGAVIGLGEIEAYGTFVEASSFKAPYTIHYSTYEGTVSGDTGGLCGWTGFTTGTLTYSFEFNTDVSFYKVGFPAFWAYPGTPLQIDFTKDGEVVLTRNHTTLGDGGFALPLGETLPAGQYVCKITILDNTLGSAEAGYPEGAYQDYIVVGYADNGLLGTDYVVADRGQPAIDIYSTEENSQGFIKRAYKQHVNIDVVRLDGADQENADNSHIIVDENSKEILVHGWLAANFPVEKYGYKIDGGEAVYDDSFMVTDYGTADNPNMDYFAIMEAAKNKFGPAGNGYRANVKVPVTAGKHTVEIVAYVNGADRHIRTFSYGTEAATAFVEYYSRDQITLDGVDKAKFGGNDEVTNIDENLFDSIGKKLRIWGWYGNNKGLDKYGVKVDGGEIVYFDRYEAEDIVNHIKTNLIKDDDVYASRFEIFVDITGGEHTVEVFAIANGEERLLWTVNYNAIGDSIPETGDASVVLFAVIAVLAMGAAVVFVKKKSF
ncbi:MAG: discoidin domain-containing protein [Clostridia bacterium]|nr:discoidin domain-containing protein [Clostridia bacterium]